MTYRAPSSFPTDRTSPVAVAYFLVDPRAITRRYEKRARPVTISSVSPSASASTSAVPPRHLNGSTATQKPSSDRVAPEPAGTAAREAGAVGGVTGCTECRPRSRNSLLTSRAVCRRWRGSFSRHRRMMRARSAGRSVRTSASGCGVSRRIADASSADESPSNGRRPLAISYSSAPSEKMSVR